MFQAWSQVFHNHRFHYHYTHSEVPFAVGIMVSFLQKKGRLRYREV